MKVRRNGERWPPGRDDMSARSMRWGAGSKSGDGTPVSGLGFREGNHRLRRFHRKGKCAGTPRGAHTAYNPLPSPIRWARRRAERDHENYETKPIPAWKGEPRMKHENCETNPKGKTRSISEREGYDSRSNTPALQFTKRSHSGLRPLRRVAGNDRNMGESDWIRHLNFYAKRSQAQGSRVVR
jgi:hypothetical protein